MVDFGRSFSTHISTQQLVTFDHRDPNAEVDFPSAWFQRSDFANPSTVVPKCKSSSEELLRSVQGGIHSTGLTTIKNVKCFLYDFGKRMTERLTERWESFGYVIGEAGEEIDPWDILKIEEGEDYLPEESLAVVGKKETGPNPCCPTEWTAKAVALYILCVYRLAKITNDEYISSLIIRMTDTLKAEGGIKMSLQGVRENYSSWLSDRGFLKMVAAYDMFLHRFDKHPLAILRMGSLSSRFRDCAGLLSVGYAMTILNISAGELMDWIFVRKMGDEMRQISTNGQESGDKYSYFPYQSDMGLVSKSAYSSNANPYLFTWIHIIGSLIGHKRSINARFNFEGSFADLGMNAVLVTWVFARGGALDPQFDSNGSNYGADVNVMIEDDGTVSAESSPIDKLWNMTQGREPKTWFALLKSGGFRFPQIVIKAVERQRKKIKGERQDSVGSHVKEGLIF